MPLNHRRSSFVKTDCSGAGFTLIEVLVAVVVLSIGLLGLAGLQAFSVRSVGSAYQYTQAIYLANNMADRMRANNNGVSSTGADIGYDNLLLSAPPGGSNCFGTGCASPGAVAAADALEWYNEIAAQLPSGVGMVQVNDDGIRTGPNDPFRITVMWDDQRTGATGLNCSRNPNIDLTCYRIWVQL